MPKSAKPPRPGPVVLAVVVLVVESMSAFAWLLLIALVISAFGGGLAPIGAAVVVAAAIFGFAASAAAYGAWQLRSWAWPTAAALQVIVLLGMAVAAVYGGWQGAFLAVIALGGTGLAALLAPATRRAFAVGT